MNNPGYEALSKEAQRAEREGAHPDVVARAVLHAAASPRPKARYVMPADGRILSVLAHLPTALRDSLVRRSLHLP